MCVLFSTELSNLKGTSECQGPDSGLLGVEQSGKNVESQVGSDIAHYRGISTVLDTMALHAAASYMQGEAYAVLFNLSDWHSESIETVGGEERIQHALAQDDATENTLEWGTKVLDQLDRLKDDDYIRCARCCKITHVDELDEESSTACEEDCREEE